MELFNCAKKDYLILGCVQSALGAPQPDPVKDTESDGWPHSTRFSDQSEERRFRKTAAKPAARPRHGLYAGPRPVSEVNYILFTYFYICR